MKARTENGGAEEGASRMGVCLCVEGRRRSAQESRFTARTILYYESLTLPELCFRSLWLYSEQPCKPPSHLPSYPLVFSLAPYHLACSSPLYHYLSFVLFISQLRLSRATLPLPSDVPREMKPNFPSMYHHHPPPRRYSPRCPVTHLFRLHLADSPSPSPESFGA